jgi:putative nucleotidyltransferase with HDIG domain
MANKHPSREECLALLHQYHTPDHVVKHCVKVAETALKIGQALNGKDYGLDLELIQSAGLIHDIARVEDKHWDVGADIASELGYGQEAAIIKVHMHYSCDPKKRNITETDIICLADRMVKEDEFVGLDDRMQYILDKFQDDPEAVERISERIKDNRAFIGRIEKIIGMSIESLMRL